MGFLSWLFGSKGGSTVKEVSCKELFEAAAEYTLSQFAFSVCVNMVAAALGRCDFLTYAQHEQVQGREYWLWNVEPNLNENSSAFLHKIVDHLYRNNEALIVSFRHRDGYEMLAVADSWVQGDPQVTRMNEYREVTVDGYTFSKRFREDDVLHLRLNQEDIRPVLLHLTQSWARMVELAQKHFEWDRGQHWKVHVSQMAAGQNGFEAQFAQMIAAQVKPFLEQSNGVLPEFDGYEYKQLGGTTVNSNSSGSTDVRELAEKIFDFTARGFLIPTVLMSGQVEGTSEAMGRFLTEVIDPLSDQLQEEINRKRYGFDRWQAGDYLRIDSSSIIHYDLFGQAAAVEKLIGSGVYSINDILRAVGQGTINEPWADKHYLTKNISELSSSTTALGG